MSPRRSAPPRTSGSRTSLRPDDVQVAELYDGFTFNCLSWLEGLGFCGIGEAKDFLREGRTSPQGASSPSTPTVASSRRDRTHGMGFINEAVTQLRGDGGSAQVDGRPAWPWRARAGWPPRVRSCSEAS